MSALGHAWRRLSAKPGHAALSVLVLGMGLGAVVFVFGLVDGLILRPLPFPDADRLVAIGYANGNGIGLHDISADEFLALRSHLKGMQATDAYAERKMDLDPGNGAVAIIGTTLSASVMPQLGVVPLVGRGFRDSDELPGAEPVVLLRETLWRNAFHGDRGIVGRPVRIDGEWATVVGVLPASFGFPYISEAWTPARLAVGSTADVDMIGRLADGTTLPAARSELAAVATNLGAQLRGQRAGRRLVVKPLALRFVDESVRTYAWLMFAAGTLVLLLACVNMANLQLVQAIGRRREYAVRAALGATRIQLLREGLAEGGILAACACLVALAAAETALNGFVQLLTTNASAPPYFIHIGIDPRTVGFAATAALVSTILACGLPALQASRVDVHDALRDGDRGASGGRFVRTARLLVIAEVALTVVLLVGAGTFIRGLDRLLDQPTMRGTDPAHVLTAHFRLTPALYPDAASRERYVRDLTERLRGEGAVVDATVSNTIPMAELGSHEFIQALGTPRPASGFQQAQLAVADERFATTYGIHQVSGRFFDGRDDDTKPDVVVIDQRTADTLWPGRDAVGQALLLNPEDPRPTVLRVIGTVEPMALDGSLAPPLPAIIRPLRQTGSRYLVLAIHTRDDAGRFTRRLVALARDIDDQTPLYAVHTQAEAMAIGRVKFVVLTQVFGAVGLLALLLAAAGLYGVLAFAVAQRTRDIGIRRAIGASTGNIVLHVARQLAWQLGLGLVVGVTLALPWSSLLADDALHTAGHDGLVFAVVLALVIAVALLAAVVPVRRALAVDPVIALRHE